jgi:non-specific serine/threonine protein kinase/serine/threonine-protein kinase Stk1
MSNGLIFNQRYQKIKILGAGGMGIVYQVKDLVLDGFYHDHVDYALKVLNTQMSHYQDSFYLLLHSFEINQQLEHPNLLKDTYFGICQTNHCAFILMPLIQGELLSLIIDILPKKKRVELADSLSRAVIHCHQRGVIYASQVIVEYFDVSINEYTSEVKEVDYFEKYEANLTQEAIIFE